MKRALQRALSHADWHTPLEADTQQDAWVLAGEAIHRHGPDLDSIIRLNFNANRIADRVCRAAETAPSSRWASTEEDVELMARRIVLETYSSQVELLGSKTSTIRVALTVTGQQIRGDLEKLAHGLEHVTDQIGDVASQQQQDSATLNRMATLLTRSATAADGLTYLRTRIADWDRSPWHTDTQQPSILERPLSVTTQRGKQTMSTDEALRDQHVLVILGDPGAGKSWLARRYARTAAVAALERLEAGAELTDVELPILTTWDMWTRQHGDTKRSLVDATFASGLGHTDLGDQTLTQSIRGALLSSGQPMLAVIDSLDEASSDQSDRLHEVMGKNQWRTVITSRHGAWKDTYRGDPDSENAPRIAELTPLTYPADVTAFVHNWFKDQEETGNGLVQQLNQRSELQSTAVVPLFLTFYCLLAEQDPSGQLPRFQREFYNRIVRRLLAGQWNKRQPLDLDYCETLLADWAWHAVGTSNDPHNGLGTWTDTFEQPTSPGKDYQRAIDNVAPIVRTTDEGVTIRRFRHRTILEHLVAEHIATLPTEEAATILLPHLWYDRDWQVAAPAAIIAHNSRHQTATNEDQTLLGTLLIEVGYPQDCEAIAKTEIDRLLLQCAQHSDPTDWNPQTQKWINQLLVSTATVQPSAVAATAHWTESNSATRSALLTQLQLITASDERLALRLVEALVVLQPTPDERATARGALLTQLTTTGNPWLPSELVDSLVALATTRDERATARATLLTQLTSNPRLTSTLVEALVALQPTPDERATARGTLLTQLTTTNDPRLTSKRVEALVALQPTPDERTTARGALLTQLTQITTTSDPWLTSRLVEALIALQPTLDERATARSALLTQLTTTSNPWLASELVDSLVALATTPDERATARGTLLTQLTSNPRLASTLVDSLVALATAPDERATARGTLLTHLTQLTTTSDPWLALRLVEALVALQPTPDERDTARGALLTQLTTTSNPRHASILVEALAVLQPIPDERATARGALLTQLTTTSNPWLASELVDSLVALATAPDERATARGALLTQLTQITTTSDPRLTSKRVEALIALQPTPDERTTARSALLTQITTTSDP